MCKLYILFFSKGKFFAPKTVDVVRKEKIKRKFGDT